MRCPKCAAKLLPVKKDFFCLQCGELIFGSSINGSEVEVLRLENTSESVLQRAILDASEKPVAFDQASYSQGGESDSGQAVIVKAPVVAETHTLQATSSLGLKETILYTVKPPVAKSASAPAPAPAPAQVPPSKPVAPVTAIKPVQAAPPAANSAVALTSSSVQAQAVPPAAKPPLAPNVQAAPVSVAPAATPMPQAAPAPITPSDGSRPAPAVASLVAPAVVPSVAPVDAPAPVSAPAPAPLQAPLSAPVAAATPAQAAPAVLPVQSTPAAASSQNSSSVTANPVPTTVKAESVLPAAAVQAPEQAAPISTHVTVKQPYSYSKMHFLTHNLAVLSVLLGILALVNVGIGWYFQDKFYPGVTVAGRNIGGISFASATDRLKAVNALEYVDFVIGSTSYHVKTSELGVSVDQQAVINQAKNIGRDSPLPIWGLYESVRGVSVATEYAIDDKIFDAKVAELANQQNHVATPARAFVVGSNVVALSEKAGSTVETSELAASIRSALKTQQKVVINTTKVEATPKITDYKTDIDAVQARLGLSLSVKLKTKTVSVPAVEIAKWLGFDDPGIGPIVNQAKIGTYIGSLGSGFDRAAAVAAMTAAVKNGKDLAYVADVKKTTSLPKLTSSDQKTLKIGYCLARKGVAESVLSDVLKSTESAYADSRGWSLGGLLKYDQVASGCNFTVWVVSSDQMTSFSPACDKQSTCRVGNNLVINEDNWRAAPSTWSGTLEAYRLELINHETGHWLGFDHQACGTTSPAPMQATNVLVWGCSPNWWSVAPELQDVKVLPGF